jgi:hypothetical protein
MDADTVLLFTRNGLGHGPEDLQILLAQRFLSLVLESGELPGMILFYTDGVRLVCEGSQVLSQLEELRTKGVILIICKTCLDYLGLTNQVKTGIVGGMPDIIEAMNRTKKLISL